MVLTVGLATILIARLRAIFELDMKKIVALSTLRQLGIMFTSLGLSLPSLAILHLLAHAFFKALLFISVGQSIHLSSDYQDLRRIGVPLRVGPTISIALLANLRLVGAPFMSGFYSKDAILEMCSMGCQGAALHALLYLSVLATAAYCMRFTALVAIATAKSASSNRAADVDTASHLAIGIL